MEALLTATGVGEPPTWGYAYRDPRFGISVDLANGNAAVEFRLGLILKSSTLAVDLHPRYDSHDAAAPGGITWPFLKGNDQLTLSNGDNNGSVATIREFGQRPFTFTKGASGWVPQTGYEHRSFSKNTDGTYRTSFAGLSANATAREVTYKLDSGSLYLVSAVRILNDTFTVTRTSSAITIAGLGGKQAVYNLRSDGQPSSLQVGTTGTPGLLTATFTYDASSPARLSTIVPPDSSITWTLGYYTGGGCGGNPVYPVLNSFTTNRGTSGFTWPAGAFDARNIIPSQIGAPYGSQRISLTAATSTSVPGTFTKQGETTSVSFDSTGRITSITNGNGTWTYGAYDTHNNLTSLTNPDARVTTLAYNAVNRLTTTTARGVTWTRTYGSSGWDTLSVTDNLSTKTVYTRNASGQVTSRTDSRADGSNASSTAYTYVTSGNGIDKPASIAPARGMTKQFDYDATHYAQHVFYNNNANPVITYQHNALGQMTQRQQYDYNTTSNPDQQSLSYGAGALLPTSRTTAAATRTYTKNGDGRHIEQTNVRLTGTGSDSVVYGSPHTNGDSTGVLKNSVRQTSVGYY
jgi:YD repeat-containing protein